VNSATGLVTDAPSAALVYDFLLGGTSHRAVDRQTGKEVEEAESWVRPAAMANRAFLRRAVDYLVRELGISQFLDLGSGVPTVGNVHEIAQRADAEAQVTYVDSDPVVYHAIRRLADPRVAGIHADLRAVDAVLAAASEHLDFSLPVAITAFASLHFLACDSQTEATMRSYRGAAAPGSSLVITHYSDPGDGVSEQATASYARTGSPVVSRSHTQIERLLGDWPRVDPGIVPVIGWRPDGPIPPEVAKAGRRGLGGIAYLPDPLHGAPLGGTKAPA
jgi:hypothetical protein